LRDLDLAVPATVRYWVLLGGGEAILKLAVMWLRSEM
jgi:hypothetical protein